MTGIYIHVPFCKRKCPYCDFYSVRLDERLMEEYTEAVCRNILSYKGQGISCDTIYFGGGTPSLLSALQVKKILDACRTSFDLSEPEITLEANPSSVDYEKLSGYRKAGINRLSFGVQSADDTQLEFLGRLHDFSMAERVVQTAVKVGFENISCDLMLGLSGQTMESLERTLEKLTDLPINHISAYMLKIEEGTRFDCDEVKRQIADEDLMCDMYLKTVEYLSQKGFEQYEISNFAKGEKYSRHNLKYWKCEEYIGLGPASHSYFDNQRYFCPKDVADFISRNVQTKVVLESCPDRAEEYIMLNLRLKWGIDLSEVKRLFSESFAEKLLAKAEFYEKNGLCKIKDNRIALTPKGFLVSNDLIVEFIDC